MNVYFSVFFLFFLSGFDTQKVKAVVNEDGYCEGVEEQVMVDESDVVETIISEKGNESKHETNTGNFNCKKHCNR